ncbi:3'(2'),5'-bisphosphate nucleotidase CysQ [Luteimicrobium xylanilyticum]|uniref:3'(2'),5'-bisphosphate nucleotidase n=1 Tax=Luteimicrobium xylanilyticum TaxID=1133546 RepID=A0A5P9QC95_9MICO|nr:3'(2'),5'-bisphosphate nucleotidase [Luteimicrobium xylanilyticum]
MSRPEPVVVEPDLDDAGLAAALAEGAGRVLVTLRDAVDEADDEFDPNQLKAEGDARSQAWLASQLLRARGDDLVLSEEAVDDVARLDADRVWIVDPLDGTREFAERADGSWRTDFAVHVALWERGGGLTAGAVGLPARDQVFDTSRPALPDMRDTADVLAGRRPLRLAASRSRPPAFVAALAERGDVELVPMGSAGVKVVSVVDGTVDAYVHGGGQYEWDSAAPVAVAEAAGYVCTRLDGSELEYNRENPWLPDLFVSHPALAAHLRQLLDVVGATNQEGVQP